MLKEIAADENRLAILKEKVTEGKARDETRWKY